METLIKMKLEKIEKEMSNLEYVHLYYLKPRWKELLSQKIILTELLNECKNEINLK